MTLATFRVCIPCAASSCFICVNNNNKYIILTYHPIRFSASFRVPFPYSRPPLQCQRTKPHSRPNKVR